MSIHKTLPFLAPIGTHHVLSSKDKGRGGLTDIIETRISIDDGDKDALIAPLPHAIVAK